MEKLDKFVIDRKKWARGSTYDNFMYDDENDLSCCLGLYAEHCGISKRYLNQQNDPADVVENSLLSKRIRA